MHAYSTLGDAGGGKLHASFEVIITFSAVIKPAHKQSIPS